MTYRAVIMGFPAGPSRPSRRLISPHTPARPQFITGRHPTIRPSQPITPSLEAPSRYMPRQRPINRPPGLSLNLA
jgi:hypothetical protein